MIAEFDISEFQAAFGYAPVNFDIKENSSRLGGEYYRKDFYGRSYFMPVKLGGLDLWLPVVGIAMRNIIEETMMVERRGSVKELITLEDVVIIVRGIIKRPDGSYPDWEIMELRDLREQRKALRLECALTDIFLNCGADNVVIRNLVLPPRPGFQGSVAYELELVSDQEFTLEEEE